MNILSEIREVSTNPFQYIESWKNEYRKKVIGFFCSYTPEELIFAADALPVRMFGTGGNISLADAHLQAYSCSLVRGALEDALSGKLNFLDGAVFPHTCDTIQRLSDIWRLNTSFNFFADLVMPVKLNTESAREYMTEVLRKFRGDLEKGLGVEITDEKLRESIEIYNNLRKLIKKVYELRSRDPEIINSSDLYSILKSSMIMDRREISGRLSEIIKSLEENDEKTASGRKRLILSGGICNQPDIYTIIEDVGGDIVWDDLCTGTRYFDGEIDSSKDPISGMADRYINRVVCPAKHFSLHGRGGQLVKIAKEQRAEGVIFLLLKFCDPHAFDYPYLKASLDREGIPSMLLEIEEQLPPAGQLKTRLEAFLEIL